jgi:Tfp pilus assembly protein PilE
MELSTIPVWVWITGMAVFDAIAYGAYHSVVIRRERAKRLAVLHELALFTDRLRCLESRLDAECSSDAKELLKNLSQDMLAYGEQNQPWLD